MLLILTALRFEACALARGLKGRGGRLRIAVTGAGAASAGPRATELILRHRPARVLGVGLCGALVPEVAPGSLAAPARIVGAGQAAVYSPSLALAGLVPSGTLLSVVRLAATPSEKAALARTHGARWVDQEGCAWAAAARACGTPWAVLRVVLDGAADPLPAWRLPATWGAWRVLPRRARVAWCRLAALGTALDAAAWVETGAGDGMSADDESVRDGGGR